jgi:hypothetical protein
MSGEKGEGSLHNLDAQPRLTEHRQHAHGLLICTISHCTIHALADWAMQAYNWHRHLAQRVNKKPAGTTRASGGLSPDR